MLRRAYEEKKLFFRRFLASPSTVGSVTPSSRFLTEAIFRDVEWDRIASIAELGAGTGVFTHVIAHKRRPECRAAIFELDDEMRRRLERRFHDLSFYSDACLLPVAARELGVPAFDCIVSGLPFAVFPQVLRDRILDAILASLAPGGIFCTFQYSLQMREQLKRRFGDVRLRFVPFNVPPAVVYSCSPVKREGGAREV